MTSISAIMITPDYRYIIIVHIGPQFRPKRLAIAHGFRPKTETVTSAKKYTIQRHISRGIEWRKFQLYNTFQCGVNDLSFGQNA